MFKKTALIALSACIMHTSIVIGKEQSTLAKIVYVSLGVTSGALAGLSIVGGKACEESIPETIDAVIDEEKKNMVGFTMLGISFGEHADAESVRKISKAWLSTAKTACYVGGGLLGFFSIFCFWQASK